jgi:hypothetical protein
VQWVRIGAAVLALIAAFVIALSPDVLYAPVPRTVLFFLLSLILAIFLGSEAVSQLQLQLPGFIFTTTGAVAVCFASLWVLTYLAKPEHQVVVLHIFAENGDEVSLDHSTAVKVYSQGAVPVDHLSRGNKLVLIFPEQVGTVDLAIKPDPFGPAYTGQVSYTGTRITRLTLGKELKQANK